MKSKPSFGAYTGPAGGWGSVGSLRRSLSKELVPVSGSRILLHQNKPDGFACVSCAWAKPAEPRPFEFCEEGAKATTWEITRHRAGPEFFAEHSCAELETWTDHDLEAQGRLTHPLRWDRATDKYVPVSWPDAMAEIGSELKKLDPKQAVFYSSGRASLEASYMYALFARLYGTNNLPDSSNMCHESTSVGLPLSIGVPVGTITLNDFDHTKCILFFGNNTGVTSPRMLHDLQRCAQRDVPIIVFNPLRERGFERFTNPQNPVEMLTGASTPISSQYHQITVGGDKATLMGLCKAVLEMDRLDHDFIAEHTHGFDEFAAAMRAADWGEIERRSGLSRAEIERAAAVYAKADAAMLVYGMGLTQQIGGVENVQMIVNLLLLRGNIGKPGAGVLPVRGHSNVQGQRTVGITEKPDLAPLDKLKKQYGFEPPREKGLNVVEAAVAVIEGDVKAMVQLGGNLVRSLPDHGSLLPAWRKLRLTVQILTKPNRSCLVHGEVSYILPCLGRIEQDRQEGGLQAISMEDSTACIHGSRGVAEPASEHLRSEPWIIAELAKATLPPNQKIDWNWWVADYTRIRAAIAETYPNDFHKMDVRMWEPGGFHRPLPARQREWKTETGKANFITPTALSGNIDTEDPTIFQLTTFRSQGQFNTTVYADRDRFRGIEGTRMVAFMNRGDIDRLGLAEGATVSLVTAIDDGVSRRVDHFIVHEYDIPAGCVGGYYPECNPLIPVSHHAEGSFVPAAKGIPVRIVADGGRQSLSNGHGSILDTARRQPVLTVLAATAAGFLVGASLARRK